jgi:hypothetical protein
MLRWIAINRHRRDLELKLCYGKAIPIRANHGRPSIRNRISLGNQRKGSSGVSILVETRRVDATRIRKSARRQEMQNAEF